MYSSTNAEIPAVLNPSRRKPPKRATTLGEASVSKWSLCYLNVHCKWIVLLWLLWSFPVSATTPNIIIVSIDGLRADRTVPGGNKANTTPVLQSLMQDSVWFENAFSQSNESLHSHGALMTSLMPTEISGGEYLFYTIPDESLMLAEILSAIGYATGGFVAGGHIKAKFGFDQGFDHFQETSVDFGSLFESVPEALRWIGRQGTDKPWFAFIHGYDCHRPYAHTGLFWHPFDADYSGIIDDIIVSRNSTEKIFSGVYYPSANLRRVWHNNGERMLDPTWYSDIASGKHTALGKGVQLTEEDLFHLRAHYDSGVLVSDTYLGLLVDQLKRTGKWDNLVLILLSDHGEDLQDHGFTNHRAVLFDSTTHVPFLITGGALPKEWRGRKVDSLVDALDLVPTVTTIAETVAPNHARGQDLWTALQTNSFETETTILQQGVLGQVSLRSPTHRFTFSGAAITTPNLAQLVNETKLHPDSFALYDTTKDPNERNNILHQQPDIANIMRQQMVEELGQLKRAKDRVFSVDEELKQMLQSRGYW